jgi:hypothetical protein
MDNKRIEALLRLTDESMNKLEELEISYKEQKNHALADLSSHVYQLAVLSDSQAIRAQVLRELYWNQNVSSALLSEAFGLTVYRLIKIVGPQNKSFNCINKCGNSYTVSFASKTEMESYLRDARNRRGAIIRSRYLCTDCEQKEQAESKAEEARRKETLKLRDEQLKNMSWDQFIESREWIEHRNQYIHWRDYSCELCGANDVTLYVHFNNGAVQGHPSIKSNNLSCAVFCSACKVRCSDLIIEEKGEAIKPEFLSQVMDWNQQN